MKAKTKGLSSVLIGGIIIALIFGLIYLFCWNKHTHDITVTDKNVKVTSSGEKTDSKYLIFTDDGTYEITDSLFNFRFDSSDLYGQIKVGERYTITTVGIRIPFFSCYENILEIERR